LDGVLWLLGVFLALRLLYLLGKFVYTYVILSTPNLKPYGAGNGAWAVVTGASDGIGKGFAKVLAQHKFNVVLVSRTESKLNDLAAELKSNYGVETRVVAIDVADAAKLDSNLQQVTSVLSSLEKVTILVNNVGVNNRDEVPIPFEEQPEDDILRLINVNIIFTTRITKHLLPFLRKNKRSAIVTLSSISHIFPSSPFLTIYAATKAFDAVFAQGLAVELKQQGVDVIAVSPSYVASNMTKIRRTSFFVTSPESTAKSSLAKLGSHQHELTPDLPHALFRVVLQMLPTFVVDKVIFGAIKDVRNKFLKKQAAKKTE